MRYRNPATGFAFGNSGKSTEGRPFIEATIASPETLRDLERYDRFRQPSLADPRRLSDGRRRAADFRDGNGVLIHVSIYATEIASDADRDRVRLSAADSKTARSFRAILDNAIFVLVPSLNPDGVDIVTRLV